MNPETKAIGIFETEEDAKLAGHTVPLSESEAAELLKLKRSGRGAALAMLRGSPILTKSYVPPRRNRDR
jgi:hypothetical protein